MSAARWLMKSEPEVFGIDDLARKPKKTSGWDGVRNYQARNFMRAMKAGDQAFFYHSNAEPPGVAGVVEIVREAYPDPSQFDRKSDHFEPRATTDSPVWSQVDVKLVRKLPRLLTLEELRGMPELEGMVLLRRGSRLSVQPVSPAEWAAIVAAAR
jgi:predicted RNA-binding protein with PUA-like domain